eukprot:jgi/Bigna1/133678/aug1.22_g8386
MVAVVVLVFGSSSGGKGEEDSSYRNDGSEIRKKIWCSRFGKRDAYASFGREGSDVLIGMPIVMDTNNRRQQQNAPDRDKSRIRHGFFHHFMRPASAVGSNRRDVARAKAPTAFFSYLNGSNTYDSQNITKPATVIVAKVTSSPLRLLASSNLSSSSKLSSSSSSSKISKGSRVIVIDNNYNCKKPDPTTTTTDRKNPLSPAEVDSAVQCSLCRKSFYDRSSLRKHKLSIHLGMRPFKCTKCNSTFTQKKNLKDHARICKWSAGSSVVAREAGLAYSIKTVSIIGETSQHSTENGRGNNVKIAYISNVNEGVAGYDHIHRKSPSRMTAGKTTMKRNGAKFTSVATVREDVDGGYNKSRLRSHRDTYSCRFCVNAPRTFTALADLRKHLVRHHGTRHAFHCHFCRKAFYFEALLEVGVVNRSSKI